MHDAVVLPWAALASIAAAIVQAGMLLQRIKQTEARVKNLEHQVRGLELWQQRQRGRQEAASRGPALSSLDLPGPLPEH